MPEEKEIYVMDPHPDPIVATENQTPQSEPPTTAETTLAEMVRNEVSTLRVELVSELRLEVQKEIKGGFENYVKNQELPIG